MMKEQHPWKIISERINILLRIINVGIFLGVSNLLILNLVICAQNSQWTFSSCQVVSSRRHFPAHISPWLLQVVDLNILIYEVFVQTNLFSREKISFSLNPFKPQYDEIWFSISSIFKSHDRIYLLLLNISLISLFTVYNLKKCFISN